MKSTAVRLTSVQEAGSTRARPESSRAARAPERGAMATRLLALQRSHGNRFVSGWLGAASERQRCHCGGTCSSCKEEHEHDSERPRCQCGGTCSHCRQERAHDERAVVASMLHSHGRLDAPMQAFLEQSPMNDAPAHARCPMEGCTDEEPMARHQGSGTTVCDKATGRMVITSLTEHCAGDCVFQHEREHQLDDAPCCARVKACIDAAPDAAGRAACRTAYDAWFASMVDHAECVAYTKEVTCLTRFIAGNCGGKHEAADAGALVGGVIGGALGGIGGFITGGFAGAAAGAAGGAATGAAAGFAAGSVTPACCTTLKSELTFAKSQKAAHCAAAVTHPCPV